MLTQSEFIFLRAKYGQGFVLHQPMLLSDNWLAGLKWWNRQRLLGDVALVGKSPSRDDVEFALQKIRSDPLWRNTL